MVVTATTTTRAVSANQEPTKKRKKQEDGSVVLPSGVTITWEPEGMSVEVGEPYPPSQRRSRRNLVDRGVGPTSGCGLWKGHGSAESIAAPIVPSPVPSRCDILAPYLVPTTPKRKKSRVNVAETAPDPDAPKAPANNIEQPAPTFINVDDILPSSTPSKREIQRRKKQSREAKASFWAGSVAGQDKTPSLVPPPHAPQKVKKRAWGKAHLHHRPFPTPRSIV